MLRSSGTTLLMPRNTPHMATGLVALSMLAEWTSEILSLSLSAAAVWKWTNVGKMGAVENKMPFIPQCPGPAQSTESEMPGDGRFSKPTLFHRQGMRPHAELHQQPYPVNGHWKLKVRHSFQLTGTQKPCKVCAEFCPFGGSCSWGHMQPIPNPAEQTLHVRLKLCTYRRWFSRPAHQVCPVYWIVPMSTAKLQRILRFRMGSHLLPIEQGHHLRLPRHRHVYRICHTEALGDERHMLMGCPALADLRDEFSPLVAECSDVMARLVWARNQPLYIR